MRRSVGVGASGISGGEVGLEAAVLEFASGMYVSQELSASLSESDMRFQCSTITFSVLTVCSFKMAPIRGSEALYFKQYGRVVSADMNR
jgi:hypothetical protein